MSQEVNDHSWCAVDLVLHVVSSKWTIAIVGNLVDGPQRPVQLSKALNGINQKILTDRLRELEKWGLINRQSFHEIPPRVEYSLTQRGYELLPMIQVIKQLGETWQKSLDIAVPTGFKQQCNKCFRPVKEAVDFPAVANLPLAASKPVGAGEHAGNGHN